MSSSPPPSSLSGSTSPSLDLSSVPPSNSVLPPGERVASSDEEMVDAEEASPSVNGEGEKEANSLPGAGNWEFPSQEDHRDERNGEEEEEQRSPVIKADGEEQLGGEEEEEPLLSGDETEDDDGECLEAPMFEYVLEDYVEKNFRNDRFLSEIISIEEYKWKLIIFPNGNRDALGWLSIYLEVAEDDLLPPGWSRKTKFYIGVKNIRSPSSKVGKEDEFTFNAREKDRGFVKIVLTHKLVDPGQGFLTGNGSLILQIRTKVTCDSIDRPRSYHSTNSREEVGYVGIRNQGATCYMNSLLQALFHLDLFRLMVYRMTPPEAQEDGGEENGSGTTQVKKKISIPYALQSLFYRLQTNNGPVSTKQLTTSFGWDDRESFLQHDVTEFNRVLIDTLETRMKGTPQEALIHDLFRGRLQNYIECVHVNYNSINHEHFYDLLLNVEGCKDVYQSLRQYVAAERLEGSNQYHAEGHGLQDAMKGVRCETLPVILELNLKRFKHDYVYDTVVKINDRFEFYPVIDLKDFYTGTTPVSTVYHLHAVLVHSGTMNGGHYYAYIRPTLGPEWFRFDDESVFRATEFEAIDDNFGAQSNEGYSHIRRRFANAYMLFYIRDSDVERVLSSIPDSEIPKHLVEMIEQERIEEERRRKEREESLRYMGIKVVWEEDIRTYCVNKTDLVSLPKVEEYKVERIMTVREFREMLEGDCSEKGEGGGEEAGENEGDSIIEEGKGEKVRLFDFRSRQNGTVRPSRLLTSNIDDHTVEAAFKERSKGVFVEQTKRKEAPYFLSSTANSTSILLFFKYYDPVAESLIYLGHLNFLDSTLARDLYPTVRHLLRSLDISEVPFALFEELKHNKAMDLHLERTLKEDELQSGDIIIIQREYPAEEKEEKGLMECPDFLSYLYDRVLIHFKKFEDPQEIDFSLELGKSMSYDSMAKKVGDHLGVDPDYLRFTSFQGTSTRMIKTALSSTTGAKLKDFSTRHILLYEKLEEPLHVMERKVKFTLHWRAPDTSEVSRHTLFVFKTDKVSDLIDMLTKCVELTGTKKIRMIMIYYHRIRRIFRPETMVGELLHERLDDSWGTVGNYLAAEEILEDELEVLQEQEQLELQEEKERKRRRESGEEFYWKREWEERKKRKIEREGRLLPDYEDLEDEYFVKSRIGPRRLDNDNSPELLDDLGEREKENERRNGEGKERKGEEEEEEGGGEEGQENGVEKRRGEEEEGGERKKEEEGGEGQEKEEPKLPSGKIVLVQHIEVKWMSPDVFGEPFLMCVKRGEKLTSVKERIKERLKITTPDFDTWKFHIVMGTHLTDLDEDELIFDLKLRSSDYIGMEHKKIRKGTYTPQQAIRFKSSGD